MPPKNPVRAARQAGRQAVRAARDTRRETVGAAKTASKVAKIESRTAKRVGRISGTPATKSASTVAKPAVKTPAPTKGAAPKTATKTGLTGKDLLTYNVKPKAPAAKGPSYAPFKTTADQKKSQQMTADDKRRKAEAAKRQQEAAANKAAADKKKAAADAKKKQEAAARKKQEAADKKKADEAAAEEQRKKDMFLQPGETRENTLPYPFTEKAKLDQAKRELKEKMEKMNNWVKDMGTRRSNPDFTRPEPAEFGPKYKRGGSTKKYQAGGTTVKPPRGIRGPKQSPSDMRQPFSPSQKPVGPGNTAKTPKPYRKSKLSNPVSIMKPMKKGGSMKGKNC
jgi:hypothetical protein